LQKLAPHKINPENAKLGLMFHTVSQGGDFQQQFTTVNGREVTAPSAQPRRYS
jgi:hypothetical protein